MYSAIKPYFELCRVSNLPTVWTNVLAPFMLSGVGFFRPYFLILSLSMSLFYFAGMCLNDIFDATIDKQKRPSRPIASGRISIRRAFIFTSILFVTALCLLLLVPHQKAVFAGLLLMVFIILYDKFHKAHPLSVLLMAGCRLMIYVTTAIAISGTVQSLVIAAGIIQFAYIIIISLAARYENQREKPFSFPLIPYMISFISFIDGLMMAVFVCPLFMIAGVGGTVLTLLGQKFVRGD